MLVGNNSQNYGLKGSSSFFKTFARVLTIKSSRTELIHLSIATILGTGVGLSLSGYRFISLQFLAMFVSAFLVHELAHKFLAQYYGSWEESRAPRRKALIRSNARRSWIKKRCPPSNSSS